MTASWWIVLAGVFDMLDGRIARMARATSSFGVEYDSLSDLISFGLAPAMLLYLSTLEGFGRVGIALSFFFVVCGALRLARFNVVSEKKPSKLFFQGLPIPISAGAIVTLWIFQSQTRLFDEQFFRWALICLSVVLPFLMVSTLPFPSFKELNWRSRATHWYLIIGVFVFIAVLMRSGVSLFVLLYGYILCSLGWMSWRGIEILLGKKTREGESISPTDTTSARIL